MATVKPILSRRPRDADGGRLMRDGSYGVPAAPGRPAPDGAAAFAKTEPAFDYFTATLSYLRHHGKPVAFYASTAISTAFSG
jgi:hypothetical protein